MPHYADQVLGKISDHSTVTVIEEERVPSGAHYNVTPTSEEHLSKVNHEEAEQATNNEWYASDSKNYIVIYGDDDGDTIMDDYQSKMTMMYQMIVILTAQIQLQGMQRIVKALSITQMQMGSQNYKRIILSLLFIIS